MRPPSSKIRRGFEEEEGALWRKRLSTGYKGVVFCDGQATASARDVPPGFVAA